MSKWSDKLETTFGLKTCSPALFYEFEFALRFELGHPYGMDKPIRRFLQAHNRASTVAEILFSEIKSVHAFTQSWGNSTGPKSDFGRLNLVFPEIERANFDFKLEHTQANDDPEVEFWHVTPLSDSWQIKELLWIDLANEMPIQPASIDHNTWLVDFDREIILNAYDDRGMDIISMQKSNLEPLYTQFNSWLLDYDRAKMSAVFKAL